MKRVIQLALASLVILAACKKTETAPTAHQSVEGVHATQQSYTAASLKNPTAGNYCISKGISTAHGYIKKVTMGTINNLSGNNGGYADFTTQTVKLEKATTCTIGLTPGFVQGAAYFEYWTVYIDYNHDGIFEANERVAKGNAAIEIFKSFTIPPTAMTGPTRMRIQMQAGAEETDPCAVYTYGEVEDYTVNLVTSL